jgi:hypothetical protein
MPSGGCQSTGEPQERQAEPRAWRCPVPARRMQKFARVRTRDRMSSSRARGSSCRHAIWILSEPRRAQESPGEPQKSSRRAPGEPRRAWRHFVGAKRMHKFARVRTRDRMTSSRARGSGNRHAIWTISEPTRAPGDPRRAQESSWRAPREPRRAWSRPVRAKRMQKFAGVRTRDRMTSSRARGSVSRQAIWTISKPKKTRG